MALLRFIVLQTILAAGLVAAYLAGPFHDVLAGDSRFFVGGTMMVGFAGLFLIAMGRIQDAARVRDLMPVGAVLAMQLGIVAALAIMGQALMASGDPSKAVGGFFGALSTALHVSVTALASYIWLTLTIWLTGGDDA